MPSLMLNNNKMTNQLTLIEQFMCDRNQIVTVGEKS